MKKQTAIIMLAFLWLCVLPSRAQSNVPPVVQMSHSQLKKLEREASTAQQFNTLASYYRYQEQKFRTEAADQKTELDRRSQNLLGPVSRSPRPVDTGRNLYDYYVHQADQAAKRAVQYEKSAHDHAAPDGAAA